MPLGMRPAGAHLLLTWTSTLACVACLSSVAFAQEDATTDDCVSRLEAQMDDYIECEGRLQGCLSDGESGFEKLMEGGDAAEKEEEEILLHYGFLLLTLLLVVGFLFGYVLEKKHFTYVHEAGGHLLLGVFAGLVLSLMFGHSHESETGQQHEMVKVAKFDTEIFFLVLLPPIIFEAGYNMQRRKFFANIGAICMFAFIGTLVSTVLIAGTVFYTSQATGSATHGESAIFAATSDGRPFNGLESCIFGALISATDPVTVLAVFGAMGADLNLFSMVFGESVLNDAVAIVLYRSLDGFNPAKCGQGMEVECPVHSESQASCLSVMKSDGSPGCLYVEGDGRYSNGSMICSPLDCAVTSATVGGAFGNFVLIFVGSVSVGSSIAIFCSLLYKHTRMYEEEFEHIEMILLVLFPYMAWMMAEALQLSGIVSILFCGIVMAHYTTHNLHPRTEIFSRRFFKTLAFGSESFVFIYMGLATFTYEQDWEHWPITIVAIIIMLLSRALNVYPNAWLCNLTRKPAKKIPMAYQHIMWFSGLRGAIAFALALQAAEDYAFRAGPEPQPGGGLCILTMTLSIIIFTVLSMGGSIYTVMVYFDTPECSVFEPKQSNTAAKESDENKALGFDRKYFKPVFTWRYQDPAASNAEERDPRWSATNKSGLIHEKEAAVAVIHADSVDNGVDEEERASLLTSSV